MVLDQTGAGRRPRGYLRPGQLDATTIVAIDSATGTVRLVRHPDQYPRTFYAEVRATNADGFMEQVLIIVALAEPPRRERALDIFTQRSKVHGIRFMATAGVDSAKIDHASRVAKALLSKDAKGLRRIIAALGEEPRMMTLFKTFEERNTAISFQMFADDYDAQDLEDEEIIPDYFRLAGPRPFGGMPRSKKLPISSMGPASSKRIPICRSGWNGRRRPRSTASCFGRGMAFPPIRSVTST